MLCRSRLLVPLLMSLTAWAVVIGAIVIWTAPAASGQDGEAGEQPPPAAEQPVGEPSPAATSGEETTGDAPSSPAIVFGDDLDVALRTARETSRPVLVVAVPDWYESPVWKAIETESLATDAGRTALAGFVPVLLRESRDREVHARHRVPFREHPLAVVLGADGAYLGFLSGLPDTGGAAAWADAIAAVPARARRTAEVRDALAKSPDDPALLLELGTLLLAAGERTRADEVFARLERVDPLGDPSRLGEARYQRLRMRVVDLTEQQKSAEVEPLCLKWRRRFAEHVRAPEVLLLQANARFLANDADGARELWTRLTKDHADSDAAKRAKACLSSRSLSD